jgi:trimeric autotransporter adhesin
VNGRLGDNVKFRAGASVSAGQSTYGAGFAFGW